MFTVKIRPPGIRWTSGEHPGDIRRTSGGYQIKNP